MTDRKTNAVGIRERISRAFSGFDEVFVRATPFEVMIHAAKSGGKNATRDLEFSKSLSLFSNKILSELTALRPEQNVVCSPLSIQVCGAMARLGAEHETAAQLHAGLGLIASDAAELADCYHALLAAYAQCPLLTIANKLYVMRGYAVRDEYHALLTTKFNAGAEELDFAQSQSAAASINGWAAATTQNRIRQIVSPDDLNALTRLVLVNAVHFKGEWAHSFPKGATREDDFFLDERRSVRVPMMNLKEKFRYANLTNFDAQALEMPYKDSDLAMLVILPNSRTGLKRLQRALLAVPLSAIVAQMSVKEVDVKLPKFKSELSVELQQVFINLGMTRMFSDEAEFGKMLKSPAALQVSKVIHKAFIDVNEEGTEAAAVTAIIIRERSMPAPKPLPKRFHVDKPFYYAIKSTKGTILFAGNCINTDLSK